MTRRTRARSSLRRCTFPRSTELQVVAVTRAAPFQATARGGGARVPLRPVRHEAPPGHPEVGECRDAQVTSIMYRGPRLSRQAARSRTALPSSRPRRSRTRRRSLAGDDLAPALFAGPVGAATACPCRTCLAHLRKHALAVRSRLARIAAGGRAGRRGRRLRTRRRLGRHGRWSGRRGGGRRLVRSARRKKERTEEQGARRVGFHHSRTLRASPGLGSQAVPEITGRSYA